MRHWAKSAKRSAVLAAALVALPGMQGRMTNFEDRLLASHNLERELQRVPQLTWNDELAKDAGTWARYLANTGRFEHSPNAPGQDLQGENIWGGTQGSYTPEAMVNLWIDEKKFFVPGTFPSNSASGRVQDVSHYTQLIWKQTREVGCAIAKGAREEILVCRYSQPGNIIGSRPL